MKTWISLIVLIFAGSSLMAQIVQSQITGTVTDEETGEVLPLAVVKLFQEGGSLVTGAYADFDGIYQLSELTAGRYDLEVSYVGYTSQRIEGIVLKEMEVLRQHVLLGSPSIPCCCFIPMPRSLLFNDGISTEMTFTLDRRGMIPN